MTQIATLFANDINRQIEEVIKVDQTAEDIVAAEVDEYVVTDAIKRHFVEVFERYQETPQKPHEGIAVWVSGFFGSGKSSFAKVLGLTIENRTVLGEPVSDRFLKRTHDAKLSVVLKTINEQIPTHTVIFDVSTDRGIRSGNQMLSQIMYRLFLASLGYSDDLDLSELEINLEQQGELEIVSRRSTRRRPSASGTSARPGPCSPSARRAGRCTRCTPTRSRWPTPGPRRTSTAPTSAPASWPTGSSC